MPQCTAGKQGTSRVLEAETWAGNSRGCGGYALNETNQAACVFTYDEFGRSSLAQHLRPRPASSETVGAPAGGCGHSGVGRGGLKVLA